MIRSHVARGVVVRDVVVWLTLFCTAFVPARLLAADNPLMGEWAGTIKHANAVPVEIVISRDDSAVMTFHLAKGGAATLTGSVSPQGALQLTSNTPGSLGTMTGALQPDAKVTTLGGKGAWIAKGYQPWVIVIDLHRAVTPPAVLPDPLPADPKTAALAAAHQGTADDVQRLLDKGQDVNAVLDTDGQTLLLAAAAGGRLDTVKLLLGHKADVKATLKNGNTPLLTSLASGHPDLVPPLLGAGSDVNVKNAEGSTPLLLASQKGYGDAVGQLLDKGADAAAKNNQGQTADAVAATPDIRTRLLEALRKALAKQTPTGIPSGGKEIGYYYKGTYASVVKTLLDGAPSWQTPKTKTDAGQPPHFDLSADMAMRDTYVIAAILGAWGTEAHARQGMTEAADQNAADMMKNLKQARDLCSDTLQIGPGEKFVTANITCDYLKSLSYP